MTAKYAFSANQNIAVPFFHGFLPHMVPYAKLIIMAIGGECRSVVFVLSFHVGSAANTSRLEMP